MRLKDAMKIFEKMSKNLKLEVIDPTGNVVTAHHFKFEAGVGNRLMLSIEDKKYLMSTNGGIITTFDNKK